MVSTTLPPAVRRLVVALTALLLGGLLAAAQPAAAAPRFIPGPPPTAESAPRYAAALAGRVGGRVVNGDPISISSAPYQVVVSYYTTVSGQGGTLLCGGSILDASTILTAAHCFDPINDKGVVPASIVDVWAGISNLYEDKAPITDVFQDSYGASVRVHPSYHKNLIVSTGDVAVLKLATPLDLTLPGVATIPLAGQLSPADGERLFPGPAVVLSGFGKQLPRADANGELYMLKTNVVAPDACPLSDKASTGLISANSGELCVMTSAGYAGNSCSGDSGGPLVTAGINPQLVGVVSNGPTECDAGAWSGYADVTAPEHRAFIDGNNAPPVAPRQLESIQVALTSPVMPVGSPITCQGGKWSPAPARLKWVVADDRGTRLATGDGPSLQYVVAKTDVGKKLRCRAYASNDGGVQTSRMAETPFVPVPEKGAGGRVGGTAATPKISIFVTPRKVKRGKAYAVTLTFTGLTSAVATGKAALTVKGWKVIGGTTRFKPLAGGGATMSFKYRVPKKAKRRALVKLGVKVALASATGGSLGTASSSVKVRVK